MSIKIQVTSHGTKQLGEFMKNFAEDIRRVNKRSMQRVGLMVERQVVQHISNQDLGWQALSPRYAAQKAKEGHSGNILVRTSTYLQSITSHLEKGTVWVGVNKDVRNEDGQTVASIAAVLEYGSLKRGIPPRPLWSVVLREVADWVVREQYFASEIIKELKKKYGGAGMDEVVAATVAAAAVPRAAVNSPELNTGKRGGRFHISASGRKVYHKRP